MTDDDPQKQKKAVALRYNPEQEKAPRLIGKGLGLVAEQILELARQHNITIHEDRDLVEILAKLDPGEEIPSETYMIVAEILAFVYQTNEEAGKPRRP
ncbi:MAG: FhlB domain-containing protein [Desulfobulbaceae bacterium]|nr:MAG: FhlB domain-containing protein [Desulfobulbaceae bacterium]